MVELLINFIDQYGLLALFILMFFNNVVGIIPGGLVSLAAGSFASLTHYNLIHTIMATTIGSLGGAFILYILGGLFGYNWLLRIKHVERIITKEKPVHSYPASAATRCSGLRLHTNPIGNG